MPDTDKTDKTVAPIAPKGARRPRGGPPAEPTEPAFDAEEYERLLDMYDVSFRNFAEGEVVRGVVLRVSESEVIVDVGYKSEGVIALEEFRDETGQIVVKTGDSVDVLIEKTEDREGYVVLSKEKAEKMKVWDDVERAYQERRVVVGRVIERVKGGLAVDIGVRAFLPGSQVDVRPVRNLDALKGQELRMRVIKVNKKRGNIVLSRKAVLEEENAERKTPDPGDARGGQGPHRHRQEHHRVRRVRRPRRDRRAAPHHRHVGRGRIDDPNEVINVGDELRVVVLKFDRETERVSLGMKQLLADPWTTATIKYPVSVRVKGKVVSLTDYGAFVELEQGVEGLIHVSEMSWSKKVKHPSKLLTVGQEVECQVLGLDQEAHRISLGLKQVESNPWEQLAEKYPIGSKINGKVRNLTEFGAFVEVEEGIDGLIHISDLSWTKRVKHPSEILKKGDTVEAVVLNIDAENQRLSLGLKQLATDVWDDYLAHHKAGEIVEGKIVRLTTFGAFVELAEGVEGLVHVSELDEKRIEQPEEHFKPGDVFPMKIIKVQEGEKKIGLSIRAVKSDEFQKDFQTYRESTGSERSTLGDVFRAAQAAAAAKEKQEEEEE